MKRINYLEINLNMEERRNGMRILYAGDKNFEEKIYTALNERGLGEYFTPLEVKIFPSREIKVRPPDNVRRKRVYIIWGMMGYSRDYIDPNIQLMGLTIANDAAMRASAAEITDVIPFLPYMRQDRKDEGRAPITGSLVMKMLKVSGADRIVTVDMHAKQAEGFFDGPVDHLEAMPIFADEFFSGDVNPDEWVIMGPDMGAMKLARAYKDWISKRYGYDIHLGVTDKTRSSDGTTTTQYVIGEVEGRNILLVDDMIDSGGSIVGGVKKLKEKGAKRIVVAATHGIFSEKNKVKAEQRLRDADIEVYTTDTIPRSLDYLENEPWLNRRSVAPLLVEAIRELDSPDGSVSRLFDPEGDLNYL